MTTGWLKVEVFISRFCEQVSLDFIINEFDIDVEEWNFGGRVLTSEVNCRMDAVSMLDEIC